jgi:hypothetical protein
MDWVYNTYGEMRNVCAVLARKPEGSDNFGNLGAGGRIILK